MRILVLSNFYPPQFIGGYELACRDMVEALSARGHEVRVLTSTYGVAGPQEDGKVYRWLTAGMGPATSLPSMLLALSKRELANHRAFDRIGRCFRPDVVYAWNLGFTSWSLCLKAQQLGFPVCYFIFDNWLSDLQGDPWYAPIHRPPRRFGMRLGWRLACAALKVSGLVPQEGRLDLRSAVFASHYLKNRALAAGRPVADAKVIHWGVVIGDYRYRNNHCSPARLLYVGQIAPHKGVHTAVEATKLVIQRFGPESARLTLVGGSTFPEYDSRVRGLIATLGLNGRVTVVGPLPHDQLSSVYQAHDILLFPSVWDEPFGITLLEAMASGLAVVATGTGGTREILEPGVNALTFHPGDSEECAMQVGRLMEDPRLFEAIRRKGRQTVEEGFRLEDTVDQLERGLFEAASTRDRPRGSMEAVLDRRT